jgi:hypothetical protein
VSIAVDIADAVVATLNAHDFGTAFTAERHYLPRYELSEMQTLCVTVVPKESTTAMASRGAASREVTVDVAVQQKLDAPGNPATEQATTDALMSLSEAIADHLRVTALVGQPSARWLRTEHTAIYAPEHLEQMRQFTSVATLTFRVVS